MAAQALDGGVLIVMGRRRFDRQTAGIVGARPEAAGVARDASRLAGSAGSAASARRGRASRARSSGRDRPSIAPEARAGGSSLRRSTRAPRALSATAPGPPAVRIHEAGRLFQSRRLDTHLFLDWGLLPRNVAT